MSSLLQKRFPIGNFKYGNTYSEKEIDALVKDIQKLPKLLKKTLKKLSGEELDTSYRPGGWTVRQVIHHLADSHINAYIRMKWAVTEATPTIKPYEEGLWAELWDGKNGHHKLSLNLLTALHKRWTVFLKNLDKTAFERGYFSPHAGRVLSLAEALALYAWHGKHHVSHIKLLTGWEPKPFDFEHETAAQVTDAPKKRGPKPGSKKAKTAEPVAVEPTRKRRRTKEEMAAAKAEMVVEPKRKYRSKEEIAIDKERLDAEKAARPPIDRVAQMAKARAARMANIAAGGSKQAAEKPAKAEKPAQVKRVRRSKEEVAAAKAAEAARPKLTKVEVLALARAARVAKIAAEGPKVAVEKPAKINAAKKEAPVRKRRSSEEVAAAKAAEAARPKLTSSEVLALARAARMAKIAAAGPKIAAEKPVKIKAAKKEKAAAEPSARKRRSSEEVAAEKAEKAARPKLTPAEQMAKARAARGTKNEAAGLPKKQYRTSEEVAAEKAEKAARPKLSPVELMAKARAVRAANIAARLAAEGHEPKPETPAAAPRKYRTAEEIAAENAEKAARPPVDRVAQMAKARAARAANIAARAADDALKSNNPPV